MKIILISKINLRYLRNQREISTNACFPHLPAAGRDSADSADKCSLNCFNAEI